MKEDKLYKLAKEIAEMSDDQFEENCNKLHNLMSNKVHNLISKSKKSNNMNRVIKFRIWDIELHMWVNNIGMGKDNTLTKGTEKRFHVMQFTGIKDKNGNEIYEGDITDEGVIMWHTEYLGFFVKGEFNEAEYKPLYDIPFIEIIGNIHQHPKLINSQD